MSTEDAFPYNGPLSTYTEWDSLLYGLAAGLALSIGRVRQDIRREPSKFVAGALVGYILSKMNES